MLKLNNDFLIGCGLGELPAEAKNELLAKLYNDLELRVGRRIAERWSDSQLRQFEDLAKPAIAERYLNNEVPKWGMDPELQKSLDTASDAAAAAAALGEFAKLKFMARTQPDYKSIVSEEFDRIADDLRGKAAEILDAVI